MINKDVINALKSIILNYNESINFNQELKDEYRIPYNNAEVIMRKKEDKIYDCSILESGKEFKLSI